MRIGGMASGMDTETMINDMMTANRIPLDKITQKKQYMEWQVNDYRTVNRQLFDFSKLTFDSMIMSTSFSKKNVTVSSPDDVAIKNLTSTSDFTGTLQIHQLAKNATLQGSTGITIPDGMSENSTLKELGLADGETSITISAPGKEATTVTLSDTDTLKSALDKINKETGVTAFYDSHTGKIAMTAKNSGEGSIEVSGALGDSLGLSNGAKTAGQNADFTYNGLRTERSSNTFQINGFEMTLKQVTAPLDKNGAIIEGGKTVTFSSSPDTDAIFDNVVKFVDEYNKLIDDLNKQTREPKYRDFHPLSAEQKKDMKEKEIELWEEKAMSGTLRNDSTISSMLTEMRTALMGSVGDGGPTLKDIGITASKDYTEKGKLVIDEEALKKAITEDPNKVHEIFSKNGDKVEDQGFARRLRTIVDDSQKEISKKAGKVGDTNDTFTLGRSLKDMDKQIDRFEDRLKMTENRLWREFTAMEQAINRANAQSAQLMSSLGGG